MQRCWSCRFLIEEGRGIHWGGHIFCGRICRDLYKEGRDLGLFKSPLVLVALALLTVMLFLAVLPRSAKAQEHQVNPGHHLHHADAYQHWRQPDNGGSCCNNADCGPSRAYLDPVDNHWHAWNPTQGYWVVVPWEKVLPIHSPDTRTHWCGSGATTYCFVPGDTLM